MGLGTAHRSKQYIDWLRSAKDRCQRCGANLHEHERYMDQSYAQFCHPPKRRPWGGGMSQKASDFGGLMMDGVCHRIETDHPSEAWPVRAKGRDSAKRIVVDITFPIRDLLAMQNLIEYAEHLDPGVDLRAEVLEYALERIIELEGENE